MAENFCHCGFGEEYFTLEGNRSVCTVCGGEVSGRSVGLFDSPGLGLELEPEPAPEPHAESGAPTRILVIDDQPFFRMRIRDILEQANHQVAEAGDGVEAVRELAAGLRGGANAPGRVVLAVLDLNMPGLIDGFQTLGVLKAIDENLPVLILTASAPTPELLKKLGQLKAKKYLNKSSKNLEELLLRNIEGL
jgi:CheY-like chemotaxis protein